MRHDPALAIAAALDLQDPCCTLPELMMAARTLAQAQMSIPTQALAPLRERATTLRAEAASETDTTRRARLQASLEHLEKLIHELEHGHAPT